MNLTRLLAGFATALVLVVGLMLCPSVWGQPPGPGGQPPGGGGGQATPPPMAPPPQPGEGPNWGLIIGIIVGVAVVAGIGVMVFKAQKNKAPVGGGVVDKDGIVGGYRLQNHLMTGQASQVWEVVEVSSGRHFAMKMLLPEKARDAQHRQFLFHEAKVGQQLAHPNIIRIVKVMQDHHNPNFVMEFFPSGSVRLRIMRKEMDFLRENAQKILKQAATALAFMNAKGWVHRDVKPDNILVNAACEVRIIDFALAQQIPTGMAKKFHRRVKAQGTRSYMSPEQIRGEALDARADIYSFGATAYEIVTGRPPFRAASSQDLLTKHIAEKPVTPQIHNPDVTDEFAELVLRMLSKKREQRPKDFHEVLMKLRTIKVFKSQTAQPSETE